MPQYGQHFHIPYFPQNHIGEIFDGTVSGVTSFGIFVELKNTVEGLVRVEEMKDDYYIFDDKNVKLVGKHTKQEFKLGDKVKVKVINANKKEDVYYVSKVKIEEKMHLNF